MNGRIWLAGSLAAAAAVALLVPSPASAELRRFTSEPIDTNASYRILYAPILLAQLGPGGGDDIPNTKATWQNVALNSDNLEPTTVTSGNYRLVGIDVKTDPNDPTTPPEVDIVIEQGSEFPEGAPAPSIVLRDLTTGIEVRETADVFREGGRALFRVEIVPPRAKLVPPGRRVYLNPNDRYEVQLLLGVRDLVAGYRETLPTFNTDDPRFNDTTGRRRRRR